MRSLRHAYLLYAALETSMISLVFAHKDLEQMQLLLKYLQPQQKTIFLALLLALSQVLSMIDPIIFGKIIDLYGKRSPTVQQNELIKGVAMAGCIAIGVALLARLAKAAQDYYTGYSVQRLGLQVFDDGLKQTLRLSFQEFEEQHSGETLSILQKVRTDIQRFMQSLVGVLFTYHSGNLFFTLVCSYQKLAAYSRFFSGCIIPGWLNGNA